MTMLGVWDRGRWAGVTEEEMGLEALVWGAGGEAEIILPVTEGILRPEVLSGLEPQTTTM